MIKLLVTLENVKNSFKGVGRRTGDETCVHSKEVLASNEQTTGFVCHNLFAE